MARELKSIAYFLNYLYIEIQRQGFTAWQKEFTRFRDKRDFDICGQLISFAQGIQLDQELFDQLKFHEAELWLLRDKSERAEYALKYLIAHTSPESVKAMALYRLADIERGAGRFESALQHYQLALQISRQINDSASIPYLLHMIGVIYWAQENLDEAIRFYEESLQHYRNLYARWSEQQLKPGHIVINRDDIQRHIGNVLRDIGDAHRKAKRQEDANNYLLESLEFLGNIGATFETALTYISLGRLNREKQLFTQSIDYYEKALTIAQKADSPRFETVSLFRLAEISYLSGNYDGAVDWAEKAIASANVYNFYDMKARALLFLGLSQLMLGNLEQGIDSLSSALNFASEFSSNLLRSVVEDIEKILPKIQTSHRELTQRLQTTINHYKEFPTPPTSQ
jgi:tetratricopeptide (TPR) repeat protein